MCPVICANNLNQDHVKIILRIICALILYASLGSCTKDISVGGDDNGTQRNVGLRVFFSYQGAEFSKDSIYYDAAGNPYQIDELKMIVSDFFITHLGDTIKDTTNFFVVVPEVRDYQLLELPTGSYSGSYGFTIGLDTFDNMKDPSQFTLLSGLRDPDLYRGASGNYSGYSFLKIKGKVWDVTDSTTTEWAFDYEMADSLSLTRARNKNFSIVSDVDASFEVVIDVDRIMKPFDLLTVDEIKSQSSDATDYAFAQLLRFQLDSSIVMY